MATGEKAERNKGFGFFQESQYRLDFSAACSHNCKDAVLNIMKKKINLMYKNSKSSIDTFKMRKKSYLQSPISLKTSTCKEIKTSSSMNRKSSICWLSLCTIYTIIGMGIVSPSPSPKIAETIC